MDSRTSCAALLALVLTLPSSYAAQDDARGGRAPLPSPEEIAKLPADGGPEFNRLIHEHSPYLLQHARNPVDWYPWGDEAFARAKELDKPVFLSVGYSSCHWCHVMEEESFEDAEVAALLNEHFVCVKVDREERPDIDHLFMTVTQAMTGSGGWPMTVVMTPDKQPFFAGTYFPKSERFGRPGMMQLVPALGSAWKTDRESVLERASGVAEWMAELGKGAPGEALDASVLDLAFQRLSARFDPVEGGFATTGPKFPTPHELLFLMQYHQRTGNERALAMATLTLQKMRLGGMYDHVGGGFHRYSTDREWLVPHFEKMLYDQALHVMAYTAAWQVTGEPAYRDVARDVARYVLRDMTSPEGAFYSAEDADSEGEEGRFYVWTRAELEDVLGPEEAALVARAFGVTDEGNFPNEDGEAGGANILHLVTPLVDLAGTLGMEPVDLRARLRVSRDALLAARAERVHPFKDDKILTDWNGLMIAALARAGAAFGTDELTEAARRAADFALTTLRDENGRLHKRARAGVVGLPATLEDYAFLVWGLLDLYEACFDVAYLRAAIELTDTMIAHYADDENGGFFLSADDTTDVVVRTKETYDGAIPSGTSVATWNLLRLGRLTGRAALEELASRAMRAHSAAIAQTPTAHTQMLAAVDFAVGPSFEIVIAGDPGADDTRAMLAAFRARYVPHKILVQRPLGDAPPITEIAEFAKAQSSRGPATAYVCRDFTCQLPTTDVATALTFLDPDSWD